MGKSLILNRQLMILLLGRSGAQGRILNHRHEDFQSTALPTELPGHTEPLKHAPGQKKDR